VLRIETRARARAVQLLYLWEARGCPPIDEVAAQGHALGLPPALAERALGLVAQAARRAPALDASIAALAHDWRLDRIGAVERAILRVALAELEAGETPPRVVIDEAVQLAHWFAGARAPAFVNGVLDGAARALGHL